MTQTRVTAAADLQPREVVRLDGSRVITITRVVQGEITYRGCPFAVAYVSGLSYDGEVEVVVPGSLIVVAGH